MREMKDSGNKWIGLIPKTWGVERIKTIFSERSELSEDGSETLLSVSEYYGVANRAEKVEDGEYVSRAESLVGYKKCYKGDLVSNIMLAWKGSMGVTELDGIVSPAYCVYKPSKSVYPRYYHYLFRTSLYTSIFRLYSKGIIDSRLRLYSPYFFDIKAIIPSYAEQQRIAEFLDRKCAEVDEMIALQEKVIEELKAYKQSVITEAVTKGLNPDAPMRDSGIEWIGQIPFNSTLSRIGFCIKGYKAGPFGSALITGNLLNEGNILIYTPEHIAKQSTDIPNNLYLQEDRLEEMSQFLVKEGEIVFPIVGSLGRAMRIGSDMPIGIINQRLSKFSIKDDMVNVNYFMWLFGKSSFYETYIEMFQRGSFIVNLTKSLICDMPIVLHPIETQRAIADYLDEKCADIDSLIQTKQSKIDSLKEYKKSIIYEYVTGKREVV